MTDTLLYEIAFDKPTELVGHAKLKLWISTDADQDDTDVFVQLRKTTADGDEPRIQLNPHDEVFQILKDEVAAGHTPLSIGYWQGV